ncbi:MAG: hypothetical protein FD145_634 [Candidatus Saganbacteria bacterium]|uniref:Type II toxin-antitoxin system HicA family toxin n=1 Tax=Candidatus Saganbacteria bacterium TaxID=2575572 RepID=A0A833L1G0_UNCSA|nr:MAG: hypothetical protein FD145_634 [Candidatus Saganbacteria bacterium]
MGHKFPQISGRECIKVLECFGWIVDRIKGSHHIMIKENEKANLSIPVHGNAPLRPGLIRAIIRDANLKQEDFFKVYFD